MAPGQLPYPISRKFSFKAQILSWFSFKVLNRLLYGAALLIGLKTFVSGGDPHKMLDTLGVVNGQNLVLFGT